MKNIDYLELFFKKHNLSGRIKVKYSSPIQVDEYMSDITFENGDTVNINDIRFDIESDFPNDVVEQWFNENRKNRISLMSWIKTNPTYIPEDIDKTSVEEFQKEMTDLVDNVKESINSIFEMKTDDESEI